MTEENDDPQAEEPAPGGSEPEPVFADPLAPEPTPARADAGPLTIGGVIGAKKAAAADEDQKRQEAAAADQAYADAQARNRQTTVDLKADLGLVGASYVELPEGGVEVYIPDGSEAGYHVIRPVAGSTPIPSPQ